MRKRIDSSEIIYGLFFVSTVLLAVLVVVEAPVATGQPVVAFGVPFNYLWAVALLCGASFFSLLFVLWSRSSCRQGENLARPRSGKIAIQAVLASSIYGFLLLAIALNADSYGVVPARNGSNSGCQVIYSYKNTVLHHRYGRFYLARSSFDIPNTTAYSWASEGHGKLSKADWYLRWDGRSGTLITISNIGIDPEEAIPAQFVCQ